MTRPVKNLSGSIATGDSAHFGTNDLDQINNLLNGVDQSSTDPVTTNTSWTFTKAVMDAGLNKLLQSAHFYYTVYIDPNDSNKVKCRNNVTGVIDSSNTDASVVLIYAVTNTHGTIFVTGGTYLCGNQLNFVDKPFRIVGEKSADSGNAGAQYDTIFKANYSGSAGTALINLHNTTYTKQQMENVVIDCNSTVPIGIDAFDVRERNPWLRDVSVFNCTDTGVLLNKTVYATIYNLIISNCTNYGLHIPVASGGYTLNTTYFYGGRITSCGINVYIEAGNDATFNQVVMEGSTASTPTTTNIKILSGVNFIRFRDCSLENNNTTGTTPTCTANFTTMVDDAGNNNTYDNCRFDSFANTFTAVKLESTARNIKLINNNFQANNPSTTATISILTGATNTILANNTQNTNTPMTVTLSDSGTNTMSINNSFTTNNITSPSSYVAYKDGSTFKVKNTQTGTIDYSGSDAATVLNACLTAIRGLGKRLTLLGNTIYLLNSTLTMDLFQSLSGESQFGLAQLQANGNFPAITIKQTVSGAAQRIEISNLYITHNQATYSDGLISLQTTTGQAIAIVDIHHCYFYDFGQNKGNAIRFSNNSAPIYKVNVYNCEMYGFQDQIYAIFAAGDSNSWMNNNTFTSINHWNPNNSSLTINSPSGALFGGNNFINCFTQSNTVTNNTQTGYDFSTNMLGAAWYTAFTNCFVWDLTVGKNAWIFNGTSEVTMTGCVPDYHIGGTGATTGKVIRNSTYSYRYGTATPSANGSTSAFTITTGLLAPPSYVNVKAGSANAAIEHYETISGNNIIVNFVSNPSAGTLTLYWEARV